VDICLERSADLHMAQLMPLPRTISCFNKIQIGFTFLVPANPGSSGQRAIKGVCVCFFTVLHALADGNKCIRIMGKILEFPSTALPFLYRKTI